MASTELPWIQVGDKVVGEGHATLPDVANRPLKAALEYSGMNLDDDGFTGVDPVINAKTLGAAGDGIADDRAALVAADTTASGREVLLPPGTYRVSSNLTIASPLVFRNGAKIMVDGGATLTLNSRIEAGNYQIFGGSGTVTGNPVVGEVNAMWFGVVPDGEVNANSGTDNSAALTKAITFALDGTNRKIVRLPQGGGHYKLGSRVNVPSGVKLMGHGPYSTLVFAATGFNDSLGLIRTTESGAGQPPGGVYNMGILAAPGIGPDAIGLNLDANASTANHIWLGGYVAGHLRHGSTNQQSGPDVVIDQGASLFSNGILVEAPGAQVITPQLYRHLNAIIVRNLPTDRGRVPVQIIGASIFNPATGGTGILVSGNNGMPVKLSGCMALSDTGAGYESGAFRFTNVATNITCSDCSVEFASAATGTGDQQAGFWIDGTSEVELHSPRTKRARNGVLLQSNNCRVFNQNHLNAVVCGMRIDAGVNGALVDGGYISASGSDGVKIVNLAGANVVQNLLLLSNTGYGINVAQDAGAGKNFLRGNSAIQNTAGPYNRTGTTSNIVFISNSNISSVVATTAAIASPTAQTAAYVQADVESLRTAIDAIRSALTANGITL